ncbi:MAG: hypothetical protein JO103_06215 [Candidatus Eremiobacteraeota bacterium]|nr:hypothetical protein [Candidatus Eremiobacteraeota bacterium]
MGINMVKASKAPPNKPPLRAIWPNVGNAYKYDDESVILAGGALTADDMLAAPQATGGVTLAQIPALIDAMVSTKLEHLKGNKRFTPQHEPPSYEEYMDLYGPMESEDIEDIGALSKEGKEAFESAQQIHNLTTKPVVEELESQGYDTTDLSYAVGANATIRFLTRARAAVQLWEQMHGDDIDRTGASTDNLDGFLTLVVSYLFNGAELTKVLPYTKSAMVLMSRTNMHSLFKLLSADEKKLFTIKTIEEISELDGGGRLFAAGFKSKGATLDGPTRAEWIDSIINGTPVAETGEALPSGSDVDETTPRVAADRLSQASKSPEALSSGSAGAQDVPDVNPRTGKNDLAVLEIRNMAKGQPLDAWRKTALTVFEMFRRLHETPEETQQRLYPQVTIHKKKTK